MATIRTSCVECYNQIMVTQNNVTIICREDFDGIEYAYRFLCPACGLISYKDANRRVADLLVAAGSRMVPIVVSYETPQEGDAITYDDIIDFHKELETMTASDFA